MSEDQPRFSVIIPVLNGAATIGEQLDALARQQEAPEFEVLVCDNGSTDATRDVVARYHDRLVLKVLDATDRKGASHARNVGLLAAKGEVLAFCDADDIVADDWLQVLDRSVAAGHMVAGWLDLARLNARPEGGWSGDGVERALEPISGYLPGIGTGNLALCRTDALRVGGFDESFRYGVEDIDFGWRAQQAGLTLSREPAVVYVRMRADAGPTFRQHRRWGRGNIMLRVRHAAVLGNVMSLRYSATKLVRDGMHLPIALFRYQPAARRRWLAEFGTTVGELEGHLLFRRHGGLPAARLVGDDPPPTLGRDSQIEPFAIARSVKHRLWRGSVHLRRKVVLPAKDGAYRLLERRRPFRWSPQMGAGSPQHGFHPGPASGGPVVRRIFLLWTGDNEMPPTRRNAVELLRRTQPGTEVILITPDNLGEWLVPGHPLHPAYEHLSLVHRSDYLRAYLMHHHGGGYSDVKVPKASWGPAWDRIESDPDMLAIGYSETTSAGTGQPHPSLGPLVRRHYSRLLGMCAFIMRPGTTLSEQWLREVESVLDRESEALRRTPGGVWGDVAGYPLRWTELLGDILHPWMLVHAEWLGHCGNLLPDVDMSTYR